MKGAGAENFDIEGVSFYAWIDMFNTYNHTKQWPDGESMLSQPAITVDVFQVIESQAHNISKRAERNNG